MDVIIQVFAFIVTILVLVSFHEAGHFLVAKLLGMKVVRFSIGFGKGITSFKDKQGTEYVIALIPLGGYVKLLDEREVIVPESEKHLAFNRQPLWARTLVILAGPVTNILFAILGFWLMFMIGIETYKPIIGMVKPNSIAADAGLQPLDQIIRVDDVVTPNLQKVVMAIILRLGEKGSMTIEAINPKSHQTRSYRLNLKTWKINSLNPDPLTSLGIEPLRPVIAPVIYQVEPNSPASSIGLKVNDRILAIDGQAIKDWYQLINYVHFHPGKKITLTYRRQNKIENTWVTIQPKISLGFKASGYLGIKPIPVKVPKEMLLLRQYKPLKALSVAVNETWQFTVFNIVVLKKMVQGQISLSSLGGPIAIFQTADDAFRQGITVFLGFLALISIMLAFINILPIPGLDGGHLFNNLIEFIIGRPVSLRYEILSIQIGMFLLIMLILFATFNDILRLFQSLGR